MRNKELLLNSIERAQRDVASAEADLERLLGELLQAPRADKTTVSRVIEEAFGKLRSAKSDLADLETIVSSDDD
ncbi:MAG: hypothetical protein HS104_34750 [Polyangiaceae bacterium]|nr:hypothetical protein [Polyangiaceae bacterium]MCE7889864.1 hypothetical protein [Sorangiineae bacterium PRO1]MCL4752466.1 hypothetical protein [Myxococcales bacterium]